MASKKSKILAMALCASVMTGIYAAPVMAEELYVDGFQMVTTNGVGKIKIASLEGLKEITLGDSVKITTTDGGIIRVGDAGGVNTRVHKDGFYVNTSGDNRNELTETSLKAGTLTLAGNTLTSAQLANIKSVIDEVGGIRRAGTTDENRSTYIEETVQVNNNGGLAVLDKERNVVARVDRSGRANFTALTVDGSITSGGALTVKNENGTASLSSTALNIGKAVTVRNDGIARFGALEGPNVRMENGVLTVNSIGETDVAKLDAEGLTLTSDTTEATLSAEQIARLNTVVTQNGESIVVTADHFKNTNESFAVDSNGAVRAANGRFNVGADGKVAIQYAGDGAIVANEIGFGVQKGSAQIVVNNSGIGMQSGTSQVVVNSADGAVFHNGEGSGHTLINGGKISTYSINADVLNGKNVNDLVEGKDIADDLDNIAGIERKTNETAASTYIEKTVRVNTESGLVVYAEDGTTFAAQIDREGNGTFTGDVKVDGNVLTEGVGRFGAYEGANVRMENGVLTINSNARNAVAKLDADGLMLTDQDSRETHTLNATDIADIKGIDRDIVEETFGDVTTTTKTTTIEGALKVSDNGFISNANESFTVDANGTLTAAGGRFTVSDVTGAHFYGSDSMFSDYTNINGGRIEINGADGSQTVINGGSVTTGTITADDLHVDNIYLGNQIVDEEGNVVGSDLAIGADGSIKIADNFEVDTDNLAAHYGEYELTLDGNSGFALGNSKASLTLTDKGYAFSGPVNLGAGSDVKYTGGNYDTLAKLDATVKDIYDRTDGIYKDSEGNTVISNEPGEWNEETKQTEHEGTGSKVVVGANGTTFENGAGNGTTNIDGSKITSDADGTISGGSGSSTNSIVDPVGSSTTNGEETVYDAENGKNTNTVNSSGMTVTNGTSTTVIDAEKVDTKTGNFSDKVTVGIQDNQTVITGGDVTVDNRVTVGSGENQTIVNNDGVTVGGADGTSINHDEVRVGGKGGSYMNDTDVVSGEGVSLNQTAERVGHLENRVGKLEDRVDKVGAMAAAIANLRTMGYDPAAPTEVAVGIGQYRDETGAALGLFHYPNRDFMLSLSVSTSGDEVMGGIGATWKFGRKSPEKVAEIKKAQAEADVRRAEEAKLAKAEEMKKAAKEAKIKAQQERHAKLAAERAAQAEAAK